MAQLAAFSAQMYTTSKAALDSGEQFRVLNTSDLHDEITRLITAPMGSETLVLCKWKISSSEFSKRIRAMDPAVHTDFIRNLSSFIKSKVGTTLSSLLIAVFIDLGVMKDMDVYAEDLHDNYIVDLYTFGYTKYISENILLFNPIHLCSIVTNTSPRYTSTCIMLLQEMPSSMFHRILGNATERYFASLRRYAKYISLACFLQFNMQMFQQKGYSEKGAHDHMRFFFSELSTYNIAQFIHDYAGLILLDTSARATELRSHMEYFSSMSDSASLMAKYSNSCLDRCSPLNRAIMAKCGRNVVYMLVHRLEASPFAEDETGASPVQVLSRNQDQYPPDQFNKIMALFEDKHMFTKFAHDIVQISFKRPIVQQYTPSAAIKEVIVDAEDDMVLSAMALIRDPGIQSSFISNKVSRILLEQVTAAVIEIIDSCNLAAFELLLSFGMWVHSLLADIRVNQNDTSDTLVQYIRLKIISEPRINEQNYSYCIGVYETMLKKLREYK